MIERIGRSNLSHPQKLALDKIQCSDRILTVLPVEYHLCVGCRRKSCSLKSKTMQGLVFGTFTIWPLRAAAGSSRTQIVGNHGLLRKFVLGKEGKDGRRVNGQAETTTPKGKVVKS